MSETLPVDRTGLLAMWMLNDGSGEIAADLSGNNHPLRRHAPPSTPIVWRATDGMSLDRVHSALHLTLVSPDFALQK
jgi:hypothetical protein